MALLRAAAVVGVAELGHEAAGRSALDLAAQASVAALADCGLGPADVDGLATAGPASKFAVSALAEHLGVQPTWMDSTHVGGASYELFTAHAAAAIALGLADVVVLAYGSDQRSAARRSLSSAEQDDSPLARYDAPYRPLLPISAYALAATRHMHEFGTTSAQLAEVAVAARAWALRNPRAHAHGGPPLTVEQVVSSPLVSAPLHRLDCCLVTDGAAAVVLTSLDRARDLPHPPVRVLGTGMTSTARSIAQVPDLTDPGAARSARTAFGRAGLGPADVDVVEVYDSFTITVLLLLEALGLCPRGASGAFVEGGRLGPGGDRPVNTDGGGLSHCHPGLYGIYLLLEATLQLRGTAGARQLARAETAVCHGTGGYLSTHATVVLGVDR